MLSGGTNERKHCVVVDIHNLFLTFVPIRIRRPDLKHHFQVLENPVFHRQRLIAPLRLIVQKNWSLQPAAVAFLLWIQPEAGVIERAKFIPILKQRHSPQSQAQSLHQ